MKMQFVAAAIALGILATSAVMAQDAGAAVEGTPMVDVSDQVVFNGSVRINQVFSNTPGWIAIHIDSDGSPGPVAGLGAVGPGLTAGINIPVDTTMITPTLFAMLHTDDGQVGTYEFDGSSGLDNPVSVDGQVVTPSFVVAALDVADQFLAGDTVTIPAVTMAVPGWVVIHSDSDGSPGPVLGQTLVEPGTTTNIPVTLAAEGRTSVLWPMLHVDDGTAGTYEFDGSSGLDNPAAAGGVVATAPLWTVPHARVSDQVILYGDNSTTPQNRMASMLTAESVLCETNCFLVVHVDNGGSPGPVAGFAAVPAGSSQNVVVVLGMQALTPVLWPMLHVDDGAIGTYEFDGSSGLDNPISVDGSVVTFPVNAAPSMTFSDQEAADGMIRIDSALMDAFGWMVIHSSVDGRPGPVLGYTALRPGVNSNIAIEVDPAQAGTQVFPMLHYDTNTMGVYEFGTVEGADVPVSVGGAVVVAPMAIPGA
ncbi:MAG: hypothetical protein UZ15_CFX003003361 [Chloroflexi bacterium OLB15]|nr:MAG: hypothetical protein UZ15_CFX003003361 [Chloroflexi bacterium OLB15]